MPDPAIRQYMQRYAHATSDANWPFSRRQFDYVVVIPAYAENPAFIEHALRTHGASSVLLIVVANAPDNAPSAKIARTQTLLSCTPPQPLIRDTAGDDVIWHAANTGLAVWIIDCVRTDKRLPSAEGVGLARKIGMDRALAAIVRDHVRQSLIYCNDADGQWPNNYFDAVLDDDDSAITFAFEHVGPLASSPAQRTYDLHIRDYPASLTAAGSGYGFQALGSAMAVSAKHYARVRGCPRRAAGEDFHLLAKLAKVGRIRHRSDICVALRARCSTRVPFGTGPAVARLLTLSDPPSEPLFYSEDSYRLLAGFLVIADEQLAERREALTGGAFTTALQALINDVRNTSPPIAVFEPAACTRALLRARDASRDIAQRRRQFHTWFDALRTLQLMHRLRDAGLANMDLNTLRERFPERYARATQIRGA